MRLPLLALWLTVLWVALWGELSAANVLGGLLVAAAAIWLLPMPGQPFGVRVRPWHAAVFAAYFAFKLVQANLLLAWEIVTPRNKIRTGIVAVPVRGCSDMLVALVANAITLTPGTLSLEVRRDPATLYVHVLHLRHPDEVRREVLRLERLAILAFGDDAARASLDQPPPTGKAPR
jgi:multicomponent Na+:H+ antiporter subunit E